MAKLTKQNDPTIAAFEKIVEGFDIPIEPTEHIFNTTIKPVIDSPYLFNCFHWVTNVLEQKLIHVHF